MSRSLAGAIERSRVSEGRKPPFLTADRRDIALLNYEVDPSVLARRVPEGCELDDWNGRHFATLAGFRVLHTRVLGVALPFHGDFLEVDFRFYVRRRHGRDWRRGVVSIKEMAPRRLIAFAGRHLCGENFVALPMRRAILAGREHDARMVAYGWRRRGAWESLSVRSSGGALDLPRDAEERFIADRHWGFTRHRGGTFEYQVEHPPWRLYHGDAATFDADVPHLYGPEFMEALCFPPRLALTAEGSPVIVRRRRRVG